MGRRESRALRQTTQQDCGSAEFDAIVATLPNGVSQIAAVWRSLQTLEKDHQATEVDELVSAV